MRTDVKALPLEGSTPLSAQPAKQTGDGSCDQKPAGASRKKEKRGPAVESCRLALKARGVTDMGDIKRVPFESHRGIDPKKRCFLRFPS